MTLEEQIKHYRKQAGLSQEKMAEKIGVSRQAITKWENGTGTPDIANLMAIADFFQISVDELLSNEKSEKKQSDYIYESRTEYDIDGKKNFDIKLGGAYAAVSYTHLDVYKRQYQDKPLQSGKMEFPQQKDIRNNP